MINAFLLFFNSFNHKLILNKTFLFVWSRRALQSKWTIVFSIGWWISLFCPKPYCFWCCIMVLWAYNRDFINFKWINREHVLLQSKLVVPTDDSRDKKPLESQEYYQKIHIISCRKAAAEQWIQYSGNTLLGIVSSWKQMKNERK